MAPQHTGLDAGGLDAPQPHGCELCSLLPLTEEQSQFLSFHSQGLVPMLGPGLLCSLAQLQEVGLQPGSKGQQGSLSWGSWPRRDGQ